MRRRWELLRKPFDAQEVLTDLQSLPTLAWEDRTESLLMGRSIERRLLSAEAARLLGRVGAASAKDSRQKLQVALNGCLWAFTRAQRASLIEQMQRFGIELTWQAAAPSAAQPESGEQKSKGKGKGKRGRRGGVGPRAPRGRRGRTPSR